MESDDIVFISQRERSQDIRKIVEAIEAKNRHDLL
ncbi:MAG TPA: hypothetical protein DD791_08575 [Syntrophomonas sp.]|nr:hypothetical protein [Syntrophomonas sp.]